MAVAHHQHPFTPRWASFVALALVGNVAASLLMVVVGAVGVPGGATDAATTRASSDSTIAPMGIGQQFQNEKSIAPASELPAQF